MVLLMKGSGVQSAEWHVHEPVAAGYSRIYLIENGNVTYEESGQHVQLEKDTLYLFPATVPYSISHDIQNPLQCTWFHMDFFPVRLSGLTALALHQDETLLLLCRFIQKLFQTGKQDTEYGENAIMALAIYLQEECLPRQSVPMAGAVRYIREHYREPELNVAALSARFGCTTEHFIRVFAGSMGITPYQYLLNMRMYEARRLLLENCTVSETAAAVGYENTRTFSHAFQKKYNICPSEFRRSVSLFS